MTAHVSHAPYDDMRVEGDPDGGYSCLVYAREQDVEAAARVLDAEPERRPGGEG